MVTAHLLLEGEQDPVDEQLLEPCIDVARPERGNHLVDGLHDHAAVWLALILEVLHDTADDLGAAHLVRQLDRRLNQRLVVAPEDWWTLGWG